MADVVRPLTRRPWGSGADYCSPDTDTDTDKNRSDANTHFLKMIITSHEPDPENHVTRDSRPDLRVMFDEALTLLIFTYPHMDVVMTSSSFHVVV